MLCFHPLYSPIHLRPFNFHRDFKLISPRFGMPIVRLALLSFEIDTGEFTKFITISPLPIGKPSDYITGFHPLPRRLNTIRKEVLILKASLCCKPITALMFNEVDSPALGLTGGKILTYTSVNFISF